MKTKIIKSEYSTMLDDEINEWIDSNTDKKIIDIKPYGYLSREADCMEVVVQEWYALIIYEEKYK